MSNGSEHNASTSPHTKRYMLAAADPPRSTMLSTSANGTTLALATSAATIASRFGK